MISIIILVVAAYTAFRFAPSSVIDPLAFVVRKDLVILSILSVGAFINLAAYILASFGRKRGDAKPFGRFWP